MCALNLQVFVLDPALFHNLYHSGLGIILNHAQTTNVFGGDPVIVS